MAPTGCRTTPRRSCRGFTLIEMLVVLAIMMTLAMFMVPTLKSSLHRAKIVGAAKQISIVLFQARFEAIKKGAPVTVAISGGVLESTSGGTLLSRVELPGKVSFEASRGFGGDTVSFQSDGSADKTGAFRIVDGWGNQMAIAVDPKATARVQVLKSDDGGVTYRAEGTGGVPWTFQ